MAAASLITAGLKITGLESDESLLNAVYEISKRVNGTVPEAVQSGHVTPGDANWAVLDLGSVVTVKGLLIFAAVDDVHVDTTYVASEVAEIIIPEGEVNFLSLAGIVKVKSSDTTGEYDYIVFGDTS